MLNVRDPVCFLTVPKAPSPSFLNILNLCFGISEIPNSLNFSWIARFLAAIAGEFGTDVGPPEEDDDDLCCGLNWFVGGGRSFPSSLGTAYSYSLDDSENRLVRLGPLF